jgi:hypothetical protein
MEKVDLIASGYEWECLECKALNHEIEALEEVICANCGAKFDTDLVEHAYP